MRKQKLEEIKGYVEQLKIIAQTEPEIIPKGRFLKVAKAFYTLANGKTIVREEIIKPHNAAVVMLPITMTGNVVLVIQPRPMTKEGVTIELPAGYVDQGESHLEAAYRELKEETGYSPTLLHDLGNYYQDQGCSRGLNTLYLATGCKKISDQKLDKDEFIIYFECLLEEMHELINMGHLRSINSMLTIKLAEPKIHEYVKLLNK